MGETVLVVGDVEGPGQTVFVVLNFGNDCLLHFHVCSYGRVVFGSVKET